MKRLLSNTLSVLALSTLTLSSIATSPASAGQSIDRTITSTSHALPLLEGIRVQGRVIGIEGNRVQVVRPTGEVDTYRISQSRQQQVGIQVGSNVTLNVRRLNDAVLAINEVRALNQQQATTDSGLSTGRLN